MRVRTIGLSYPRRLNPLEEHKKLATGINNNYLILKGTLFFIITLAFAINGGDAQNSTTLVPSILTFGDSAVDVGNNDHIHIIFKANFPPYGRDFINHKPTGRLCNSKPTTDIAVSMGVLYKEKPAIGAVVELVGGPLCQNTRTFSIATGGGAFCNWQKIQVSHIDKVTFNKTVFLLVVDVEERPCDLTPLWISEHIVSPSHQFLPQAQFMQGKGTEKKVEQSLLVTGFGYEHDDAWSTNIELFKEFTDASQGVRRLGAAAVDMCHVALGIVETYWEYRLKAWDMAAGVLVTSIILRNKSYFFF
ncbi:hypothetical protein HYC85_017972 [Camellia sinensis]|uniref:Inositol-phosphate phosphatase n=1 Tax=Camellia sinensis TaxID=4442 RepID=A0A7J7GUL3_CAMSI|nr:hypothetical protein HYC85_017972 [Camellia sinensis]